MSAAALALRAAARSCSRTRPVANFSARLCTSSNSLAILGLGPGATKMEIKRSFYELAKQVHPDVTGEAAETRGGVTFVDVLAAYEALISEYEATERGQGRATPGTAPSTAARGGGGGGHPRASQRPPDARSNWRVGEVLCEQLLDADVGCELLDAVWSDVKALHAGEGHAASEFMLDALFGACARTGGGFDAAPFVCKYCSKGGHWDPP